MAVKTKDVPANAELAVEPSDRVVAVIAAVGPHGRYRKGTILLADDARVRAAPRHFVPVNATADELAKARQRLYAPVRKRGVQADRERHEDQRARQKEICERNVEEARAALAAAEAHLARYE